MIRTRSPGRLAAAAGLALAPALVLGCGGGTPAGPPEIRYGLDECSHCRMIVSDPRYASAALDAEGRELRFDDLGCLAARLRAEGSGGLTAWVSTGGDGWRPAAGAAYLRVPELATPMGSGLVAFDSAAAAGRAAAARGGTVLAWSDLLQPGVAAEPFTDLLPGGLAPPDPPEHVLTGGTAADAMEEADR